MDLGDRGRGDRPVVEAREQLRERPAELAPRSSAGELAANGGRSSCSCDRSAASSWPSRSARVARLWPSLMNDGPSSCSARASRWPGRPGASWREQPAGEPQHGLGQRQHLEREQRVVAGQAAPDAEQAPEMAAGAQHALRGARPSAAPRCRRRGCGSAPARGRRARSAARRSPGRESGGCSRPGTGRPRGRRRPARRASGSDGEGVGVVEPVEAGELQPSRTRGRGTARPAAARGAPRRARARSG